MKHVSSFLRITHRPDAILLALNEKQHQGSCQWLTTDEAFQSWVDGLDNSVDYGKQQAIQSNRDTRLLVLTGRPGTGKSVTAGHLVRYLDACNLDCSFYFFRHDDKAGSTVSGLLRCLAFQMAELSPDVRNVIAALAKDTERDNGWNLHILWHKLFIERIFKLKALKTHFWVIDAIDECHGDEVPSLVSILSKLDPSIPLRVFMTSRPDGQVERLLTQQNVSLTEMSTGRAGTVRDIELFLQARFPNMLETELYQRFLSTLLSKLNGIFLWASLIVSRLENLYSVEDIQEALEATPSEMNGFYSRITDSILALPSADLATCILKWVLCSPRPLSIDELTAALNADINPTLTASVGQLEAITGHLIFADTESRVHIAHETAAKLLH